jgi:hypothetical protein
LTQTKKLNGGGIVRGSQLKANLSKQGVNILLVNKILKILAAELPKQVESVGMLAWLCADFVVLVSLV